MKHLDELRRLREIHAPEALKLRTLEAIEQGKEVTDMKKLKQKTRKRLAAVLGAAAACFIVAVNASPALALGLGNLPAIGALVHIVCLRQDIYQTDDHTVTIEVPQVKGEQNEAVNALIEQQVKEYEAKAEEDIAAYKQAFLATGGTEQQFADKDIQVKVDYTVKSETKDWVSFVLSGTQDWNAGAVERHYYNLRLSDGSTITLKDLLGEDWIALANEQIRTQIDAHNRTSDIPYLAADDGGFQTVDENTNFYLDADGNPVVVFDRYAIAPGALGEPEFVLNTNK